MKIVFFVAQLHSGGAERTVSYLSDYLAEREQVYIVSLDGDFFYELNHRIKVIVIPQKTIPTAYKSKWEPRILYIRGKNYLLRRYYLRKIIKQIDPDIVFCILADAAIYLLDMYKKMKFRLISSERTNPEYDNPRLVLLRKEIFERCNGVVFQTEKAKEYYPKSIQGKSIVIHNAVGNIDAYNVPHYTERARKLVSIGRLSDEKGYDLILKAFAIVHERFGDYVLHIYGVGKQESQYRKLAKELGLESAVLFMGASKHALKESLDASCFIMASRYEGMPNALLEAMAAGIPCVSTDCPNGPGELIVNGENGLLVPVNDVDGLAGGIIKMLEDKDFANMCGENARQIALTHNIDSICNQYYQYIIQVAGGRERE